MQTIPEFACYIEADDFIVVNDEARVVTEVDDTDDLITFALTDQDGEPCAPLTIGPFEPVERITSLLDEDDIELV
jgi:hypothetical protein